MTPCSSTTRDTVARFATTVATKRTALTKPSYRYDATAAGSKKPKHMARVLPSVLLLGLLFVAAMVSFLSGALFSSLLVSMFAIPCRSCFYGFALLWRSLPLRRQVDYNEAGLILDDDLFEILVKPLPKDAHLVCIFDCCHSGTVLDLPYLFKPGSNFGNVMMIDENFDFDKLLSKVGGRVRGFLASLND